MSSPFKFKQFTIHHERSAMKVGTDGVLLGAWANLGNAKTILDIGTGSGVIALMLAQRSENDVSIDAAEIDKDAYEQAVENTRQSPWPEKVNVYHSAIQNFNHEKKYDLIISNPPYFQNSQKPPDQRRTVTRHTDTLSFLALIASVNRLLTADGRFNVILPYHEALSFITLATQHNLYCARKCSFRTRKQKPIERVLLEFSHTLMQQEENEIVLYGQHEEWSDQYISLTREFYLKI